MDSNHGSTRNLDKNFGPSHTVFKGSASIPGLDELNDSNDEDNGLITSDSDFDQAELAAGYTKMDK